MTTSALFFALALDSTVIDSVSLSPVVVEAQAVTVSLRGDTLIFCVDAFINRKGERLKALLQDLPGVEVSADGTIRAKGRAIDRLLINGKKLTGLKENVLIENLRADALVSIRLYDEANERDSETGVIQAQEEQVMDLVTHEDKTQGWLCDVTAGAGTEKRYTSNASASRFAPLWQNMFTTTFNNLPASLGVGESYYDKLQKQVPTADSHRRNVSGMIGWEDGAWTVNASTYYDGSKSYDGNHNIFESMLPGMKSIQNSIDNSNSHTNTLSVQMGVEWHDSLTSLHIDPYINWTRGKGHYNHGSYTTNEDCMVVNRQMAANENSSTNLSAELNIRLNRQLRSKKGRNIDFSLGLNTERLDEAASDDNVIIYYMKHCLNVHNLRLSDGETHSSGIRFKASYVEPLLSYLKLQAEYTITYKEDKADYPVYLIKYDRHDRPIPHDLHRNDSLSRNADNRELHQRGRVLFQFSKGNIRLALGSVVDAGHAQIKYERHGLHLDEPNNTIDWSPEMHFMCRSHNGWSITASYNGHTHRPSIIDLIPIDDISDPLNIRCGNPELKNAFIHTMNASLFFFSAEKERQLNIQIGGNLEQRAFTQNVSYNTHSGVRRYSMVNVDGNRSLDMAWGFQSTFADNRSWYLDLQGSINHNRRVGLQEVDESEPYKYVTHQQQVTQYMALQFKNWGVSIKPYGYGRYERLRSDLEGSLMRNLYTYGYGGVIRYESQFGLSLAVDAYNHCRYGYLETDMNGNEFIIDAELCFAFLKGRNAEISFQANDILRRRTMVRNYSFTSGRSEYQYDNAVNSYAIASLTYRF